MTKTRLITALLLVTAHLPLATGWAQQNTRLLLTTGSGVPGHGGFVFGPFSSLEMNGRREIVFLSTLRGTRAELRAVVRSNGVSFSVVAFQGLLSPFPHTTYDAFSAPSMNDSGIIAFTATLSSEQAEAPRVAVMRLEGTRLQALATDLEAPPGQPNAKFVEFSAPVVTSTGNVVFGARWGGRPSGSGLFLAGGRSLQSAPLPAGIVLGPADLLIPFFIGHDEAGFAPKTASIEAADDQFFRAIALRTFQELTPPPAPDQTVELLAARPGDPAVPMVLVYLESGALETVMLVGDPSKPVPALQPPGDPPVKPVGRVLSLTIGSRDRMIFAASPLDAPGDLSLYRYGDGQVSRLTTPEDFQPITVGTPGKAITSLTSDGRQTTSFIAPTAAGDNTAIYVADLP